MRNSPRFISQVKLPAFLLTRTWADPGSWLGLVDGRQWGEDVTPHLGTYKGRDCASKYLPKQLTRGEAPHRFVPWRSPSPVAPPDLASRTAAIGAGS